MQHNEHLTTEFAPPERSGHEEIKRQANIVSRSRQFAGFANLVPDPVLVLNGNRQIVFGNTAALKLVEALGRDDPRGMRPGEALHCEHALTALCGCGTSSFCRYCGAVNAILSSLSGVERVEECRISRRTEGDSLLFMCYAYPLELRSEKFSLFILKDITHERRIHILEHVFFHDIKNTLTALNGWVNLLKNADSPDATREVSGVLAQLSTELVDEVNAQEQLVKAENNQLASQISLIDSLALLRETSALYRQQEIAQGKSILIDRGSVSVELHSDASLLKRVLANMLKNALEDTKEGDAVTLGCRRTRDKVEFWVHNPGFMPPDTQSQVFKWSFSTKSKNRGLGTYSMRLLSERYLGGKVSFSSTPEDGTTFMATYPIHLA